MSSRFLPDPFDVLHIASLAAIVWGVRQISHPAAWITAGIAGVFYSALAAIGRHRKRREEDQP